MRIRRQIARYPTYSLYVVYVAMPNRTFHISEDIDQKMKKHPEIRWGEIARQTFEEKLAMLDWIDSALSKSKFTDEDAIRIGRQINKDMSARIRKEREKDKLRS